jgi:hypothetical protein
MGRFEDPNLRKPTSKDELLKSGASEAPESTIPFPGLIEVQYGRRTIPKMDWPKYYDGAGKQFEALPEDDQKNVRELADAIVKRDRDKIKQVVCRYGEHPEKLRNLHEPLDWYLFTQSNLNADHRHKSLLDLGYSVSVTNTDLDVLFPELGGNFEHYSSKTCLPHLTS